MTNDFNSCVVKTLDVCGNKTGEKDHRVVKPDVDVTENSIKQVLVTSACDSLPSETPQGTHLPFRHSIKGACKQIGVTF